MCTKVSGQVSVGSAYESAYGRAAVFVWLLRERIPEKWDIEETYIYSHRGKTVQVHRMPQGIYGIVYIEETYEAAAHAIIDIFFTKKQ